MSFPRLATDLAAGISAFEDAFKSLEREWAPDAAPVTVSMSELGRALGEKAGGGLDLKEVEVVFQRIERILEDGTDAEKDAAATGFLEALAAAIDKAPERRWILEHAGRRAREYLAAWDRFCGLS